MYNLLAWAAVVRRRRGFVRSRRILLKMQKFETTRGLRWYRISKLARKANRVWNKKIGKLWKALYQCIAFVCFTAMITEMISLRSEITANINKMRVVRISHSFCKYLRALLFLRKFKNTCAIIFSRIAHRNVLVFGNWSYKSIINQFEALLWLSILAQDWKL